MSSSYKANLALMNKKSFKKIHHIACKTIRNSVVNKAKRHDCSNCSIYIDCLMEFILPQIFNLFHTKTDIRVTTFVLRFRATNRENKSS